MMPVLIRVLFRSARIQVVTKFRLLKLSVSTFSGVVLSSKQLAETLIRAHQNVGAFSHTPQGLRKAAVCESREDGRFARSLRVLRCFASTRRFHFSGNGRDTSSTYPLRPCVDSRSPPRKRRG